MATINQATRVSHTTAKKLLSTCLMDSLTHRFGEPFRLKALNKANEIGIPAHELKYLAQGDSALVYEWIGHNVIVKIRGDDQYKTPRTACVLQPIYETVLGHTPHLGYIHFKVFPKLDTDVCEDNVEFLKDRLDRAGYQFEDAKLPNVGKVTVDVSKFVKLGLIERLFKPTPPPKFKEYWHVIDDGAVKQISANPDPSKLPLTFFITEQKCPEVFSLTAFTSYLKELQVLDRTNGISP